MEKRPFGGTGLVVPVLGSGAMQLGDPRIAEAAAVAVLRAGDAARAQADYHRRFRALRAAGLDRPASEWDSVALRFAAYAPGVDCAIVGGTDPRHLDNNVAAVSTGPPGAGQREAIRGAFDRVGLHWRGLI